MSSSKAIIYFFILSFAGLQSVPCNPKDPFCNPVIPDTFIDVPNPRNEPVEEHLQNLDRQVDRVSRYMECHGCPSSSLCGSPQVQRTQVEELLLDEEWTQYLNQ